MARLPRFTLPEQPQHVIQRGNNRTRIFAALADYELFLDCLVTACQQHECFVHAYVLMSNHVHLLMTQRNPVGIGRALQSIGRRYVRYFNDTYQRTGTLWEGRYRAAPVDTERYLLTCYRYIELNPVRAGIVDHPEHYRWSSHRANAHGGSDPLVTPHARYDALGLDHHSRQSAYRALFEHAPDDEFLRDIRESTNKRWALGSERFHNDVRAAIARRTLPLQRGGVRTGAGRPRTKINGV